ncbi:hypothetical protein MmTuc01_2602 [Methanosarcina mazei Tuc01]|uniref:Uncharacterized protein n=1 Tax=Methanosarcina mazei Tuc01 TaxID=1236903 RepID=M1QCE3_METMZ|nr:hypothetical protein MmTuc01_2602 [Methanosarcina mazei Tuc01]
MDNIYAISHSYFENRENFKICASMKQKKQAIPLDTQRKFSRAARK